MGLSRGYQFDGHLQCLGYRAALQLAPRLKQTPSNDRVTSDDRGRRCRRCVEPDAGIRTPHLRPCRMNSDGTGGSATLSSIHATTPRAMPGRRQGFWRPERADSIPLAPRCRRRRSDPTQLCHHLRVVKQAVIEAVVVRHGPRLACGTHVARMQAVATVARGRLWRVMGDRPQEACKIVGGADVVAVGPGLAEEEWSVRSEAAWPSPQDFACSRRRPTTKRDSR
jgi:hypothetical protein